MIFDLKSIRLNSGLSQVKLAHESGVSLPTIQNIEAGKANPTIDVLEKIFTSLGFELQISAAPFDAERASAFGVPLASLGEHSEFNVGKTALKVEARRWLQNLGDKRLSEREELAIAAFLSGIRDHYPTFYREGISNSAFEEVIRKHRKDGRLIKLRRIALSNMSRYL